jgi:tRNA pseudouridine65 synthase
LIDILKETDDVLFINKASSMSVHNEKGSDLISLLEKKFNRKLHLVNRLDIGTSGIVVVAKSKEAAAQYQTLMGNADKSYKALIKGNCPKKEGVWKSKLSSKAEGRKNPAGMKSDRKEAITYWKLEKHYPLSSLLDIRIETGRKHQIRKHCAIHAEPILGDTRYGKPKSPFSRLALHCYRLEIKEQPYDIIVDCPITTEFDEFI